MADTIKPAHHAWDHGPGGEDPLIPGLSLFPWVRLSAYSRTASTGLWYRVPFRFLDYDPKLTIEGTDFEWATVDESLGHKEWQVTSVREGFYFYDLLVQWDEFASPITEDAATVGLRLTPDTNELSDIFSSADWFDGGTFTSGTQGELAQGDGFQRLSGVTYASAGRIWKPQAIQSTGDDITLGGTFFTLVRLMPTTSSDWTDLDADSF